MIYKHINFGFSIIAVLLISCKEMVEVDPPKNSLVEETVFNTNDQATAAMTGVYATMRTSNFAAGDNNGVGACAGISSDDLVNHDVFFRAFYENQLTPEMSFALPGLYSTPYKAIFTVNSILKGLEGVTGVIPSVKMQLEGEALFVRAFSYFYLTNLFGEIPLQLTSDYRVTSVAPKSSISQVYQQIVTDLQAAESKLLDNYPSNGRFRPNKSAAQALLARVYLYRKDWSNAEKYASIVIGKTNTYNLTDFDAVFLTNSKEAIWQIEPQLNSTAAEGLLFIPGSLTSPPNSVSLREDFVVGDFEVGDKRKDLWIRSYTIPAGTYYYPYKYKVRTGTTATESSMVLRLAEQYLIRAEANINQGKINEGIADLNIIRKRTLANGNNANSLADLPTDITQLQALARVEHERKVELFSEWGHRWFDLKRTNRADAVLGPVKSFWQPTDVFYPIPQGEINLNRSIVQNEGY